MICNELRQEIAILCSLRQLLIFAVGVVLLVSVRLSVAQESPPNRAEAKSGVRFQLETNSRFGGYLNVPDQWGELHLRLENSGGEPRDLLCTTYFDDRANLQFGRQVWLPARSRLSIAHPVLFPRTDQLEDHAAQAVSLVIERPGGNEVLLKSDSGQLRHDRSLLILPTARNTGLVAGWNANETVPQEVLDVVVACRVNQGLTNRTTILSDHFLPADETSLKSLDHLVLAEDRLIEDEAALTAVRRWLHAGGRLWVMLDRVNPLVLERLLGDDFQGHLVDHVGLTSVRIDTTPTLADPDGTLGELAEFDRPVEMARLVVSGMKVWNSVNGWPAALTQAVGEGRLLITTLGARGWIKPAKAPDPKATPPAPDMRSPYVPNSPMEDLAAYVLAKREQEMLPKTVLEPLAREQISYQVPSWTLIVGTMAGFLVLLFAVAILLRRMDVLEHFGWAGSLLALVFGLALTGIGVSNRYGVPGTLASMQLAQAVSGTDDVRSRGVIAVYRPDADPSPIYTSQGGELWPDMTGMDSTTRRMITTDLGTYRWDGLPQPAGLRVMTEAASTSLLNRIEASATLDARGILGKYTGHPTTGSDALLATRFGRIGVTLTPDGTFQANADSVFEADQYLAATFLGDEQDRRRRLLQQLFGSPAWKGYLDAPQLLVWVTDWNNGFQFGEGLSRQGDTLLAVPVRFTRPPSGADVVIPSPLLSFMQRRPPDGSLPTGCWDDNRREWQERSSPSTTWLSFQIPRELLPLVATKARLHVKVSGPMGRLEILGVRQDAAVSLQTVSEPAGSLTFDIDEAEALTVSDRGEVTLGVSAGVPQVASVSGSSANWRIDSLSLQLWAKAAAAPDNE